MLNKFIQFILYKIMINLVKIKSSLMAQWIARMTSDHKVGGSSPSGVAFFFFFHFKNIFLNSYYFFEVIYALLYYLQRNYDIFLIPLV